MIRISLDDEDFATLVNGEIVKLSKHWGECFPEAPNEAMGRPPAKETPKIEIMISLNDIGYQHMIEAIAQGMKHNKIL